jgi:hypothetical protein
MSSKQQRYTQSRTILYLPEVGGVELPGRDIWVDQSTSHSIMRRGKVPKEEGGWPLRVKWPLRKREGRVIFSRGDGLRHGGKKGNEEGTSHQNPYLYTSSHNHVITHMIHYSPATLMSHP